MRSERIRFQGAYGNELAARLELPNGEPKAYALYAHCFTCGKDLKAAARLGRTLVARGIALLRFDFTGLGESEGDFADTSFSSNLQDLLAAAQYLQQNYRAPQLLIGHSLGGAAVLAVAELLPSVRAVATLGAPSETTHLGHTLEQAAPDLLLEQDEAVVQLAGRPFRIRKQLLEDLRQERVLQAVRDLNRALLIMHSPVDEVVGIDHAKRLYEAATHPKSFVSLDDADHLLLRRPQDAAYAGEVLATWAGRYLQDESSEHASAAAAGPEPAPELAAGEVLVRGNREASARAAGREGPDLAQEIFAGRHRLLADEPLSLGGTDTGPGPYDYLLAALGACTTMTLRMYAQRKGWGLEEAVVKLRHSRIHARDCEECESESSRVDLIEKEIVLEGDLDEAQLERLMEIADRCPVHRTLRSETVIRSRRQ